MLAYADWSDGEADDVLFEHVYARHVQLSRTHLTGAQILDARFETCDFASAAWDKPHLRRVELLGCRMVGARLVQASLEDVLFKECSAEFAIFWNGTFSAARFEQCKLHQASFEGANLSGVVFAGCDLQQADFRNTKLVGADFRGSAIDGVQIGIRELQGAIIDPSQAVLLAALLGIQVKAVGE